MADATIQSSAETLASQELEALATLIERRPHDDVLLKQDVALRSAAAIRVVLAALTRPAGGDAMEWQRAAYASIAANRAATKLIDRMLASLGHLADGLADQKSSWADYARRLFTKSQDTAHADRLAALPPYAPVAEPVRESKKSRTPSGLTCFLLGGFICSLLAVLVGGH